MGGAGNVMLTILPKAKASNPVDCKHAIGTPQMTIGDTIEDIVARMRARQTMHERMSGLSDIDDYRDIGSGEGRAATPSACAGSAATGIDLCEHLVRRKTKPALMAV